MVRSAITKKTTPQEKGLISYALFLRGINVGGNSLVKMADLKKVLESLGYTSVKTLLASGNVIFEAQSKTLYALKKDIEAALEKAFGRSIIVIIRPLEEIRALVAENPFKKITVTPKTRLYVTLFLGTPKEKIKTPYKPDKNNFTILSISEGEACSVVTLSDQKNTTNLMTTLEKLLGKNITTRNWNTVVKMAQ